MSLNLTDLEKMAVAKVLLDIVNADGRVTVGEYAYFEQLQKVLGISDRQIEEAKRMGAIASLAVIKAMLPHEKQALAIMMYEMMTADGHADDKEKKIFEAVFRFAEIELPA